VHPVAVDVPAVLVLEGVSVARRRGGPRCLAGGLVELPSADARLERAMARDGEGGLRDWQLFEQGWFAVYDVPPRTCAVVAEM
jgi:hypothetical protein